MLNYGISLAATLLGSKLGRYTLSAGLIAILVGIAFLRVYKGGQTYERSKQAERQLQNLRNAIRIDHDVRNLSADQRRERVAKWLRNEE